MSATSWFRMCVFVSAAVAGLAAAPLEAEERARGPRAGAQSLPPPAVRRGAKRAAPIAEPRRAGPRSRRAPPSRVLGVAKRHDLPRAGGGLELQIDVTYEVRGQAGGDVAVAIWFVRKDAGAYVRSALAAHRDPEGYLTVQTRAGRVAADAARYLAQLRVPYAAFPVEPGGEYEVEARIQVQRAQSPGRVRVLCLGKTTFRVHGAPVKPQPVDDEEADDDGEEPGGDGD